MNRQMFGWLLIGCIGMTCRPEEQEILVDVEVVQWATPTAPASGVTVILEEQRVSNGVLNAFFTEVDRGVTDAFGQLQLTTLRSNVLSIRLRIEKEGCFDEIHELDPETLATQGNSNAITMSLVPQCVIQAEIVHEAEECPSESLLFRWIPRQLEGAASEYRFSCDEQWQGIGPGETQNETCLVSGGIWLLHQRSWTCIDSSFIDSVWCPPGGLIELRLD